MFNSFYLKTGKIVRADRDQSVLNIHMTIRILSIGVSSIHECFPKIIRRTVHLNNSGLVRYFKVQRHEFRKFELFAFTSR